MSDELNINEQYEQIFGKKERPNIFSPDDEDYNSLRQEIRDAKREFNPNKKLPFDNIILKNFEDFKRDEIAQEFAKEGHRIFYIKKYEGNKLVAYAAAYFNVKSSVFFVLRDSFCLETSYFNHLVNNILITKRYGFRSSFVKDNGFLKLSSTKIFDSASLAASYFLGKKSSFRAWKDERGKTLDAYFIKYKSDAIDDIEAKTFPDYKEPEPEPVREVMNGSLLERIQRIFTPTPNPIIDVLDSLPGSDSKHLFYLCQEGICKASGYFDQEDNYFYVCKDSLVALIEDAEYANTTSALARKRFIDQACVRENSFYRVTKDAKCRTASAAACYVLGRTVTYSMWKDANGKYLKDFYPQRFIIGGDTTPEKKQPKATESSTLNVFYIKRDTDPDRSCNIYGNYDATTQKFIVHAGSIFCLGAALSYQDTAQGVARQTFLNKYCSKERNGYKLKRDFIFDAPSTAASYALGRSANGWTEFRDSRGLTLNDVYRK